MRVPACALLLACAEAAWAGNGPDLLFNCNLAGQKRGMTLESGRDLLWDAGTAYVATVSDARVDAWYSHPWGDGIAMRHHIAIDRKAGTFTMEVDRIGADGAVQEEMVRETGTCSPEKIHPRNFDKVDRDRLKY